MKYYLLFGLLCLSCLFASGQTEESITEELLQAVADAKTPEEKIARYEALLIKMRQGAQEGLRAKTEELLQYAQQENNALGIALAEEYFFEDFLQKNILDSAEVYGLRAIESYQQAGSLDRAMHFIRVMAVYYYYPTQQLDKADELLADGMEIARADGSDNILGIAHYNLGLYYDQNKTLDSVTHYYLTALPLLEKADNWKFYTKTLVGLAAAKTRYQPAEALSWAQQAVTVAKERALGEELVKALGALFDVHRHEGNLQAALAVGYEKLALARKQGVSTILVNEIRQVGELHYNLQQYSEAEQYILESLTMSRDLNYPYGTIAAAATLGNIYHGTARDDEAIQLYQEAVAAAQAAQNPFALSQALLGLADIYFDIEHYEEALKTYQEAYDVLPPGDSQLHFAAKLGIAAYQMKKEQYAQAIEEIQPILAHATATNNNYLRTRSWMVLRDAYEGIGNYRQALFFYKKVAIQEDSLVSDQNIKEITALELNAQYEKEKALTALENQKQQEILQAEATANRNLAGGIGALALLGFGFFWNARRQNRLIAAQKEQLESLNTTKDHLFAIIGHDLRKPAASFSGISKKIKYLVQKRDFDTLDQYGSTIEQNAHSLAKITDNLLNWALTQRNVMPYHPVNISVREVAAEVLSVFETTAQEKGLHITNKTPEHLAVFVDPNALYTILINLVDNALKYTEAGGQITLDAQATVDNTLKISVSDTGVGIGADQLQDLFVLKKDKSIPGTSGEKGTGLGLHLVKELATLNKGSIAATSKEGKGTTFELAFPVEGTLQ